ncbi:hypothetical protein [Flavobacterium sp.]|uniref:hypothetical protein n=1 Tax=Flavobacterium sp. TaxID=239 RepID=UPI0012124ED8|nr:hypothetical protein [Flavobacterium sp.]RZJ70289.1 MAG: hypothetical protein EOO49_14255 [Flavobacterium sp.]
MNDFFAMLYEGFSPMNLFYIQGFSEEMYAAEAYVPIGIIMIITSLVAELAYYYFLSNYGNFYRKKPWFFWILIIAVINFFVAYFFSFSALEPNVTLLDCFTFSMVNVFWTMIFCFLFSIALKFKSVKASRTPF